MNIDAPSIKQAMRECAGAVALVTVGTAPGQRTGLTVTSACSLSDKPPSLIACVNRNASAHARICEAARLRRRLPARGARAAGADLQRAKGINGDDRFAFGRWTTGVTGTPMLEDAVAAFDCVLTQEFETTTHSIFVGEVRNVSLSAQNTPLLYLRGSFHGTREIRDALSLGDIDARRLSWSEFS